MHLEEKAGRTPACRPKRRTCREPITVGGWEGILLSLDLDVGKVPACTWKHALKVAGKATTKTDSIEMTRAVFPEADAKLLTRVDEHHGRAEALLIAAHGHWAALVGKIGTCLSALVQDLIAGRAKAIQADRKRKRRFSNNTVTSSASLAEATGTDDSVVGDEVGIDASGDAAARRASC